MHAGDQRGRHAAIPRDRDGGAWRRYARHLPSSSSRPAEARSSSSRTESGCRSSGSGSASAAPSPRWRGDQGDARQACAPRRRTAEHAARVLRERRDVYRDVDASFTVDGAEPHEVALAIAAWLVSARGGADRRARDPALPGARARRSSGTCRHASSGPWLGRPGRDRGRSVHRDEARASRAPFLRRRRVGRHRSCGSRAVSGRRRPPRSRRSGTLSGGEDRTRWWRHRAGRRDRRRPRGVRRGDLPPRRAAGAGAHDAARDGRLVDRRQDRHRPGAREESRRRVPSARRGPCRSGCALSLPRRERSSGLGRDREERVPRRPRLRDPARAIRGGGGRGRPRSDDRLDRARRRR